MLNEHDITKKMLNLIREATMPINNQEQNTGENQIEGDKITTLEYVILTFKMGDTTYTFNTNSDEISTNTGSDEVLTSIEDADDIKKLNQYFNSTWKPNWFNKRINEVKNSSKDETFIVSNGVKKSDYDVIYNEDLTALQTINKTKNVEIIEYKFKLK